MWNLDFKKVMKIGDFGKERTGRGMEGTKEGDGVVRIKAHHTHTEMPQ
jgi:hypothetical protein